MSHHHERMCTVCGATVICSGCKDHGDRTICSDECRELLELGKAA